ncbi:acyl-CoA thioesterase [Mangrovimonas aestuarii]|uniref:acyl-CoA thioesterase n=1 Tax=Mangrovimonas aestuarii TaxID=3018443 RepID=UPI002377E04A|nr:thioesterase family protein [Mangrovimonas aestuarii]
MAKVYETIIEVTEEHLDQQNHVNNVVYVQWVQDIAWAHWDKTATKAMTDAYYWVMINHFIEYKKEAKLGDSIKVKTYIVRSEGVRCVRAVEISNADSDVLLAKSETQWCLISRNNNRPARIPEDIQELFL